MHIQCKSNSSFKKWLKDQKIYNSGISYKDTKRMISHNMFTGFNFNEKKISYTEERVFIAILDGNWQSNNKDRFLDCNLKLFPYINKFWSING